MLRVILALALGASVGAFTGPGLIIPGTSHKGAICSSSRPNACGRPLRSLGLRMQVDETAERQAKLDRARRLAEQAQVAMREAEAAEQKMNSLREVGGRTATKLDVRSELRAKQSIASVGEVLYKSWSQSFHDLSAFGLSADASTDIMTEEARRNRVRQIFDRFDTDQSGGIDRTELEYALRSMEYNIDTVMINALFTEADTNGDGVVNFDEFYQVMSSLFAKEEARVLEEKVLQMDAAAAVKVVEKKTYAELLQMFEGIELVGDAKSTSQMLGELRKEGKISKWGSYSPLFRELSAEKMKAVTGLKDADKEMGLLPDGLINARIQFTQTCGIVALVSLLFSGLFPEPYRALVSQVGFVAFVINLIFPFFAQQIDTKIIEYEFDIQPDNVDRWARRMAGRFFAAYMCGVPVETLDYSTKQKPLVQVYSKSDGNIDFAAVRSANFTNAFQAVVQYGLTPKQVQAQAVIQCAGLMLEFMKYGKATFGFEFFEELEKQIMLSQAFVDPFAKQLLARFGILASYELIKSNEEVLEKLVEAIKNGESSQSLVAIIESC